MLVVKCKFCGMCEHRGLKAAALYSTEKRKETRIMPVELPHWRRRHYQECGCQRDSKRKMTYLVMKNLNLLLTKVFTAANSCQACVLTPFLSAFPFFLNYSGDPSPICFCICLLLVSLLDTILLTKI